MAILRAPVTSTVFEFADGILLGKLLQFPQASALDRKSVRLHDELRVQAEKLADQLEPLSIHRTQLAAEVRFELVQVTIDPKRENNVNGSPKSNNVVWRLPVEIVVHAFVWTANDVHYAALPLLNISVVADTEEQLFDRIRSQVQFVLGRNRRVQLDSLLLLPQPENTFCERHELSFDIKTPKEIYRLANATKPVSVLKDIADNLGIRNLRPIFGRQTIVREAAELLGNSRPTSVLFVGDSGVGKTAIVHEIVRDRDKLGLPFRSYWQTGGSRIVAGMCGFGAWQERCEELCREVREKESMLHLGNLFELMEVGQHESSEQGIGDYLRPAIDSGKLPCTAECTPQQLDEIQRRNPRMLDAFDHIAVPQTTIDTTRGILQQLATRLLAKELPQQQTKQLNVHEVAEGAIETTLQLHQRFAMYSARPGRIVRFFTYLVEDWKATQSASASQVPHKLQTQASGSGHPDLTDVPDRLDAELAMASFSQQTGLPRQMLDDSVPLDLSAAETWFNQRVIGQQPAISRVMDALASAKTSLTRPEKPIASFLMIGPTGVGKTELAKTLTEFLYNNPDRMTRIDMSEYSDPLAAERLAGSSWQEEGVLTSRVREQPFGVVLLDEFEKAHADVFDLLLQILGEGRLTDSVGRVADFSTSVVIMTSNLGAETASKSDSGFQSANEDNRRLADHYVKEVQRFLRPEIYNRIDCIIPFAPLSRSTVSQIVANQLDELKQRIAERADKTSIEFAPSVVELIARRGYEPTLGARPVRRQIERTVLAPIAATLNEEQTKRGGVLHVNLTGGSSNDTQASPPAATAHSSETRIRVKLRSAEASDALQRTRETQLDDLAQRAMDTRRRGVLLGNNHIVEELHNERSRLQRQKLRCEAKKKDFGHKAQQQLDNLAKEIEDIASIVDSAIGFEERSLLAYYRRKSQDEPALEELLATVAQLEKRNDELLIRLFAKACNKEHINIIVWGQDIGFVEDVADAYHDLCREWSSASYRCQIHVRRPKLNKLPKHAFLLASREVRAEMSKSKDPRNIKDRPDIEFFGFGDGEEAKEHRDTLVGFAIAFTHPLAAARLQDEAGYHQRIRNGASQRLEVVVTNKLEDFEPPTHAKFREDLRNSKPRRTYNFDKLMVTQPFKGHDKDDDLRIKRTDSLTSTLRHFIDRNLEQRAQAWLKNAATTAQRNST